MSRLDSMLRRLTAQRDGLNWAATQIADDPGDVLDLGLGNGRTYDHLRGLFPDRRIWVVDRILQCHHACVPPDEDFLQGEAEPMLRKLADMAPPIRLAHYDLGHGVESEDAAEAIALSPLIAQVVVPGGLVVSAQTLAGMTRIDGPAEVSADRYRFYRV